MDDKQAYYQRHIFFCTMQKKDEQCCGATSQSEEMFKHAREKLKSEGLFGQGKIRVSKSGCLGRCSEGPVAVVYPEGVWYTYVDQEDVDEIIDSHLKNGEPVSRLIL